MPEDVQMDYAMVGTVADVCNTAADTLNTVNTVLATIAGVAAASAFVGFVGAAIAEEVESIREGVSSLASVCTTINGDLKTAINSLQSGDTSGAGRFG